jgi:hypothetical protein
VELVLSSSFSQSTSRSLDRRPPWSSRQQRRWGPLDALVMSHAESIDSGLSDRDHELATVSVLVSVVTVQQRPPTRSGPSHPLRAHMRTSLNTGLADLESGLGSRAYKFDLVPSATLITPNS